MGEVDPAGRNGPENARTYSMNFALRCFECVGTKQGLSEEDRGLCFARLFHNFRRPLESASKLCLSVCVFAFRTWLCLRMIQTRWLKAPYFANSKEESEPPRARQITTCS